MNKICTDIHQSKTLLELGIDRKTSDMYYWCGSDLRIGGYRAQDEELDIPAWSLSALLELIPKELEDDLDLCYGAFDDNGEYHPVWVCSCMNRVDFGDTSIDAVFNMVCWLLENKKI